MPELSLHLLPPRTAVVSDKLHPRRTQSWSSSPSSRHSLRRSVLCPCSPRGDGAWGSNAETLGKGKFRFSDFRGSDGRMDEGFEEEGESWGESKRKWWFDDEEDDFLEDEIDQPWDSIWIFKVFRAYGYMLPAIIASLLITSGPKAFLMALALPLAQSALSFALDKLNVTSSPTGEARRRRRRRNSPPPPPKRNASRTAEFRRRPKEGSGTGRRPEGSTVRSGSEFGGWDYTHSAAKATVPLARTEGKLSRRKRGGEVPLLVRLIVSVFPFLGSWMRIP